MENNEKKVIDYIKELTIWCVQQFIIIFPYHLFVKIYKFDFLGHIDP